MFKETGRYGYSRHNGTGEFIPTARLMSKPMISEANVLQVEFVDLIQADRPMKAIEHIRFSNLITEQRKLELVRAFIPEFEQFYLRLRTF